MMTKAQQNAVDRERAKLGALCPEAPVVTHARWQRHHETLRSRDSKRIAQGKATSEEIQRENSIFTDDTIRRFRIVNLKQVIACMK